MVPPNPTVRSACDQCHQKKIRCITTKQRGLCDRCREHSIACTFSPAGRNGRPPRTQPATGTASGQASHTAPPSSTPRSSRDMNQQPTTSAKPLEPSNNTTSHSYSESVLDPRLESLSHSPNPYWNIDAGMSSLVDQLAPSLSIDMMASELFPRTSASTPASFDQQSYWDPQIASSDITITPITSPTHEILCSLHAIQQRLHHEIWTASHAIPTASSDYAQPNIDTGTLFQLIDEMHSVIQRCFDANTYNYVRDWCDFSLAMALTTALGHAVQVYEMTLIHCIAVSNTASVHATGVNKAYGLTCGDLWTHNPSDAHWQDQCRASRPSGTVSMPTSPVSRKRPTMPVQIGSFTLSKDIGRRVMADALVQQITTSQKLLSQLRNTVMQVAFKSSPSVYTFATTVNGNAKDCGMVDSLNEQSPMFFTTELRSTVVHLANQLQIRMTSLERAAVEATNRTAAS